MANNSSGPATVIAALILGMSVLGAAFVLQGAMDRNSQKVAETLSAIAQSASALAKAGPPAAAPAPSRARAGRPDPAKVYEVAVAEAPVQGPETADITIIEWSDFQ